MAAPLRVLFVEDREEDLLLVLHELRRYGFDIGHWTRVETAATFEAALRDGTEWDLVISDFVMPGFTGPAALALCKERGIEIPFIMVSGSVSEEQAVTSLRAGAHDFVGKQNLARLGPAVAREMRDTEHREARRKMEAQLLQAQKMDAIGQLAGGVAHDLNNIISVIRGHAELVLRFAGGEDPRRVERMDSICDASDRAASLVRQLLTVSRRQVVQLTTARLNDVIAETMRMLERILGEHITIEYRLADDLWRVRADVAQLEQVVMNLVINARDAMPGGGTLTIETRNVSLETSLVPPAGDYVQCEVTDTGRGMSPETIDRIFEPFFTTKEAGKGTGLGLATVYAVVTQAGGYIEVESGPGQGTKFRIYLPRTQRAVHAPSPAAAAATTGGSETILLVEDDMALRLLVHEVLEDAGYRVLSAETPADAVEIITSYKGQIDLLFTDVVLPSMPGTEVAARLCSARPAARVLYMSGYNAPKTADAQSLAPFLHKPFKTTDMLAAVRSALGSTAS